MNHEEEKAIADCYAEADRGFMLWGQELRARVLKPILSILMRWNVSADALTGLALVCGLLFYPLFFWNKPLALFFLAFHVLLDGLDGPLARAAGTASRSGSFTDTAADQVVVAATTTCLINAHLLGVLEGIIYVMAYTIVVGFSMIRNALGIPYSWLVRPRFFVYLYIAIELYLVPNSLPYVVWLFNILLGMKVISGFRKIKKKI
jgi:phosphatidylglycerophosphate synthase